MKIYCFGNEFIKEDLLAKEIGDELKIEGVEFIKANSVLEIADNPSLIVLDVVKNLTRVQLFNSVDEFASHPKNAHDLDLGFYLKLLKETGKPRNIRIIGIPLEGNKEKIKKEITQIISKL